MGNAAVTNATLLSPKHSTLTDSHASLLDSVLNESSPCTDLPDFTPLHGPLRINDGNLETRLKELRNILTFLSSRDMKTLVQNPKDYMNAFNLLEQGISLFENPKYTHRKLVLRMLLKRGIIDFLKIYWKSLLEEFEARKVNSSENLLNGQLWMRYTTTQPHLINALANASSLFHIVCNGSDMKEIDIQSALYDGTAELALECLDTYLYPLHVGASIVQRYTITNCLGAIHNFSKYHENAISDLQEKDALRIVAKYRNSVDRIQKLLSIFTFSRLLPEDDEKNKTVIELENSDIEFVLSVLRVVLDPKNDEKIKDGFQADELIMGVNKIAVIDNNKALLVEAGVLPHYVAAMRKQDSTLQEYAAQGIWTLAFDEKSVKAIRNEAGLMDELQSLAKSKNSAVKEAADGALWKLEEETKHLQKIKTHKGALSHIMISYQWDVKDKVMKVRERLKKEGYRVWIDDESMSGNTLESMVKAVENAAVVVPVLTEKYKASNACRQEMSYANKLKKMLVPLKLQPKYIPDGWLAFILEDTYYHDLTKPGAYESKLSKFVGVIAKVGKEAIIKPGEPETPIIAEDADEVDGPVTSIVPFQSSEGHRDTKATVFNKKSLRCALWNEENVKKWLEEYKLHKYSDKFEDYDGVLLAELAAMQFLAPEAYYSIVKQELGMALIDILRLSAALQELNPAS